MSKSTESEHQLHSRYEALSDSCIPYGAPRYQPSILAILVTDLSLIGAMLFGLFRLEEVRKYGVAAYLNRQAMSDLITPVIVILTVA